MYIIIIIIINALTKFLRCVHVSAVIMSLSKSSPVIVLKCCMVKKYKLTEIISKATPSDTLVSGPPPASDFILGFLSHYFYYACAEWSMWYKIV